MMEQHWHIVGLGWLGSAIAKELFVRKMRVSGTCRSKEKAMALQADMPSLEVTLWNSVTESAPHIPPGVTHLVLAIPPSGRDSAQYAAVVMGVVSQLLIASPEAKFIFTSSTSVYPEAPGVYDEGGVVQGKGSQVVQAAEYALRSSWTKHWIIRLSGLAGYGRVPGRYFAGKPVEGNKLVNLIHRDDIVSFMMQFAAFDNALGIVNLTCPKAVTRTALYTLNAQQYGFEMPVFIDSEQEERRIISSRFDLFKSFTFKYDSPLDFPVQ